MSTTDNDQAAKDAAAKAAADKAAADAAAAKGGDDDKVFKTQEEFDAAFEARFARERKKLEKELADKAAADKTEAERLAKLNDDERQKELQRKAAEESAKRENDLTLREMRLEARDMLLDKGISDTLVDLVVDVDADKTKANVENLSKEFNAAVEKAVEDKLKGKTPNGGNGGGNSQDADSKKKSGTVVL